MNTKLVINCKTTYVSTLRRIRVERRVVLGVFAMFSLFSVTDMNSDKRLSWINSLVFAPVQLSSGIYLKSLKVWRFGVFFKYGYITTDINFWWNTLVSLICLGELQIIKWNSHAASVCGVFHQIVHVMIWPLHCFVIVCYLSAICPE